MKKAFVLFLLGCAAAYSTGAQSNPRQRLSLDEDWRFHLGHAADPAKDFNYRITAIFAKSGKTDQTALDVRFNDSAWRRLNLPHDWAVELPFVNSSHFDVMAHGYKPVGGLFPETSVGWYRKHFTIARKDSGQRFSATFDGIFRDAHIWLNGFYLGNNQSGYVGATYDITDYVHFDGNNVLVVRADASQCEGWFYEGAGIYRHVWLNRYNNLHIAQDGVFVHTQVKGNSATVHIETEVENQNLAASNCTVSAYVTDRNGRVLARTPEQMIALRTQEAKTVKQRLTVANPRLWSLDDPYLYRVVSVVKQNGKVVDSVYRYTKSVIEALKAQGTTPNMVQIGNEVNHGIIWPEGHVSHLDSLAQLIKAGTEATLSVDPSIQMMLHVTLGGQHDESVFFIENMLARGVPFDVVGQSYYPKWHGTLDDLHHNLTALAKRYGDVILVEYSQLKPEVNEIAFNLPEGRGKGTCIWEPLNTWEKIFDGEGQANELIGVYDAVNRKFVAGPPNSSTR